MAEDAKKMAVKEEKYDPGYEAAYGGAYCDRAPYGSEQCSFSSDGTGKVWCFRHSHLNTMTYKQVLSVVSCILTTAFYYLGLF